MFQTLAQKRALRGRQNLSRFAPQSPAARMHLEHLLARGALVLQANRDRVLLRRGNATAEIDALGRVTWRT